MLGLADENDLLARLGSAELTARKVLETLYPELSTSQADEVDAQRPVIGLGADQTFKRAQCCQPVPGERIVGITYPGRGVIVHAIDCPALEELEEQPSRWVDLHWEQGRHAPTYSVTLDVAISNDAGVLGRICTLIGEQKANISDLKFTERKPDFYRLLIDVDLRDVEHLHMVILTAPEAGNLMWRRWRGSGTSHASPEPDLRKGKGVQTLSFDVAGLGQGASPSPRWILARNRLSVAPVALACSIRCTASRGSLFNLSGNLPAVLGLHCWRRLFCQMVRGNILAALLATFLSNPLTTRYREGVSVNLATGCLKFFPRASA